MTDHDLDNAPEFNDPPQGPDAVRRAAVEAVAAHLEAFPESLAFDDLWENHPLLLEGEALEAGRQAERLAVIFQRFAILFVESFEGGEGA